MKKYVLAFVSLIFLVLIAVLGGAGAGLYWYQSAGPLAKPVQLVIRPGSGFSTIARQLEEGGVIDSAVLFRAITMAKGTHAHFKAGEYAFAAGVSPQQVADLLVGGKSINHAITIPEGKNSAEIIALLMADNRLSGIITEPIEEAALLPDTHHVHRGDTRASVVLRMRQAMDALLPKLWQTRAANLPITSPKEALILASIVEKETGVAGERRKVAGVFVNRLRRGMPLQSDPTVVYAIERDKGPMGRALYRSDWKYESPYNTYQVTGLPPAPICHPGRAAIEAVLNPQSHDYLYFVATGTGGHYFAKTLAEHNRNIVRYKRALRGQNP